MLDLEAPSRFRLPLSEFQRTAEGAFLIESNRPFAYHGKLWSGYKGGCFEIADFQLTPAELEKVKDIDGSFQTIRDRIAKRLERDKLSQRRDLAQKKITELLQRNEVAKAIQAQREMGMMDSEMETLGREIGILSSSETDESVASTDGTQTLAMETTGDPNRLARLEQRVGLLVATIERLLPEEPKGAMTVGEAVAPSGDGFDCGVCSKHPPAGHPNPEGWLKGHTVKVHKQRP